MFQSYGKISVDKKKDKARPNLHWSQQVQKVFQPTLDLHSIAEWNPSRPQPGPQIHHKDQPTEPRIHWRWRTDHQRHILLHQLEKNMGRQQGKNTLNNAKNNMIPPKYSGSTAATFEHHNTDKAEEDDRKK